MSAAVQQHPSSSLGMGGLDIGGSGDDGGGRPPRRPGDQGKKGHGQGKKAQREKTIDEIINLLGRIWNNLLKVNEPNMGWAKSMVQVLDHSEYDKAWFHKGRVPADMIGNWQHAEGTGFEITRNPPLPAGWGFNPQGGNNYGPAILASASRGVETPSQPCNSCGQHNSGPFTQCMRMPDGKGGYLFHGACLNCAFGNQYARCDERFTGGYQRGPSRSRPTSTAGLPRSGSSMSMTGTRSGWTPPVNSPPPSPSAPGPSGPAYQHGHIRRTDAMGNPVHAAYEMRPPSGSGSQRGQVTLNFNYSINATPQEYRAEMHAAIRRVADEFEDFWKDAQKQR